MVAGPGDERVAVPVTDRLPFHGLLFVQQPAESSLGLTGERLIARAGATGEQVGAGIREQSLQGWSRRVTDEAGRDGLTGTPTIVVDSEEPATRTPRGLRDAVHDAV